MRMHSAPFLLAPLTLSLVVAPLVAQRPSALARAQTMVADSTVLALLSRGDQLEIALSQAALPTLRDSATRAFAQRTVDAHAAHLNATWVIADRLHLPVAPKVVPGPESAGLNDSLYIESVVTRHRHLLSQLSFDPSGLRDERLRQHVAESRRQLESHLDEALAIRRRWVAAAP